MASQRGPDWDFYQCKCGNILFEYNVVTGEKFLTDTWKNCTTSCMEPVSYVPPCARPIVTVTRPVSRSVACMATQTDEGPGTTSAMTQTVSSSACTCQSSIVLPVSLNDGNNDSGTSHSSVLKTNAEQQDSNYAKPVASESTAENLDEVNKNKQDGSKTEEGFKISDEIEGVADVKAEDDDAKMINTENTSPLKKELLEIPEVQRNDSFTEPECKSKDSKPAENSSEDKVTSSGPKEKVKDPLTSTLTSDRILRKRKSGSKDEKGLMNAVKQGPRKPKKAKK